MGIKIGDKVVLVNIDNIRNLKGLTKNKIYTVVGTYKYNVEIEKEDGCIIGLSEKRFKLYKESEDKTMTKNFKEVIADIKEGEVWESKNYEIKCNCGSIKIHHKYVANCKIENAILDLECKDYELQRNKVSFTEAFKAYEEDKEIESCVDNCIFKKINGEDNYKFNKHNTFSTKCDEEDYWFDFNHIRGEWYINA